MKKYKNSVYLTPAFPVILLLALIIISLLYGIITGKASEDKKIKVICITKIIDDDNAFWYSLLEGVETGAKEMNVDLEVMAPEREVDYERQNELIREAIEKKPDAILLTPCDREKTIPMAKEIKNAGITLVLIDSEMDEKIEDAVVSTDNYEAGVKLGEIVKDLIKENSKIAVVSHVKETSTAVERERGLRDKLGQYESLIVDVVYSNSDYSIGYKVTQELLEREKDIDIIVGLNEYAAIGAARAVSGMGMTGEVKMVGFDSSEEEIKLLEAGIFEGIVVQKAFNMGYIGLETAVKILRGEGVASNIDSGSNIVRKGNIYTEENQKLLFPFR